MNPGLGEEAGATARSIVEALKAQPAVLALTIAQVAMLVFLFYALSKAAEFRETMIANQYKMMQESQQLLARCIVPEKSSFKVQSDESKPVELEPIVPQVK